MHRCLTFTQAAPVKDEAMLLLYLLCCVNATETGKNANTYNVHSVIVNKPQIWTSTRHDIVKKEDCFKQDLSGREIYNKT